MPRLFRIAPVVLVAWACSTESGGSGGSVGNDGSAGSDGSGATVTPPSCAGLDAMCGATGGEDCCASPPVSGGTFDRSYYDGTTYSDPFYSATVSSFRLDKFEITVGRFRKFVEAGAPVPAAGAGKHAYLSGGSGLAAAGGGYEPGWDATWTLPSSWDADLTTNCTGAEYATWTPNAGDNEQRPINCLTWYEAYAFCIWDGGFLPSEAEWNYAAAAGAEERMYPWGSATPTPSHASYNVDSTQQCMGDGMPGCSLADLILVGTKPLGDGKYGQSDLGGNLMEWNIDWDDTAYPNPCNDCSQLVAATYRMTRGGSFNYDASQLLTSYRFSSTPAKRFFDIGARCARPPD